MKMISKQKNDLLLVITLNVMVFLVIIKPGLLSITLPVLLYCNFAAFLNKHNRFYEINRNLFWILCLLLPLIYSVGSGNTNDSGKALFEITQKTSIPLIGFLMISYDFLRCS